VARILVLDRQDDSRMLLKRLLERNGHEVGAFSTSAELLREAAGSKPRLVILTTSFRVSATLAADLKAGSGDIKVMTITDLFNGDSEPAMVDDFLIKPVDIEAIERKVGELLGASEA
jgi:CheY-like chemotaxis protein